MSSRGWPPGRRGLGSFAVSAIRADLRRDVEAEEDDPADLAAPDPPEQIGARGRAGHRDDELLTDELSERRGRRRRSRLVRRREGPLDDGAGRLGSHRPGADEGEGEQALDESDREIQLLNHTDIV